ncbi:MAG: 5'-3' exonuclease H3TH domain-containing protein, partial [Acidobacteriota bacterium]
YLVDASPYIFRAHFSVRDVEAPDGSPAGALYGFAHFLLRLARQAAPSHIAVAYDQNFSGSFRNDTYPAYKQNRDEVPQAIEDQKADCFALGQALGMACYIDERYEADDLIAALLVKLPLAELEEVVIVSADKDLAQLVSDKVTLWDFARDQRFGPPEVKEKFGVWPLQITDYLGLAGDSVDNIPGVKGVGPKTASALLGEFADLDELYDDLDRVTSLSIRGAKTLPKKLEANRENAFLSRDLATVAADAPVEATLSDLAWPGANRDALEALADKWGFDSLVERVTKWA